MLLFIASVHFWYNYKDGSIRLSNIWNCLLCLFSLLTFRSKWWKT